MGVELEYTLYTGSKPSTVNCLLFILIIGVTGKTLDWINRLFNHSKLQGSALGPLLFLFTLPRYQLSFVLMAFLGVVAC